MLNSRWSSSNWIAVNFSFLYSVVVVKCCSIGYYVIELMCVLRPSIYFASHRLLGALVSFSLPRERDYNRRELQRKIATTFLTSQCCLFVCEKVPGKRSMPKNLFLKREEELLKKIMCQSIVKHDDVKYNYVEINGRLGSLRPLKSLKGSRIATRHLLGNLLLKS